MDQTTYNRMALLKKNRVCIALAALIATLAGCSKEDASKILDRINSLKQTVARSKDQLAAERDRQRRQREQERLRKRQAPVGGKTL